MLTTDLPATRTLTLVLPESDWRALRDAEPDAVGWLQLQIRRRLNPSAGAPSAGAPSAGAPSAGDGPAEPVAASDDTAFDDY